MDIPEWDSETLLSHVGQVSDKSDKDLLHETYAMAAAADKYREASCKTGARASEEYFSPH